MIGFEMLNKEEEQVKKDGQTKIKWKTKTGLTEEGGTSIGSATIGGATTSILILKSEPRYSINELHKVESRSKDLKHQTLTEIQLGRDISPWIS